MEKEEKASQKKTEKPASLTTTRRSMNKEGGGGNPTAKKICHQRQSYLQVSYQLLGKLKKIPTAQCGGERGAKQEEGVEKD